jgi:N6-adenosine-specific RNA methylase IME4
VNHPLITIDAALHALASATTPDELITLADQAEALRVYVKRAKLGLIAQNRCADIRLRADRKAGQVLKVMLLHGRPKSVRDENSLRRLAELGVSRGRSHRTQRMADIPTTDFEGYLRTAQQREWEITTGGLFRYCNKLHAKERNRQRIVGGRVEDLIDFARDGPKMGCIVLDPAWPILGSTLPYETIELDELKKLPIPELAAERCHLHLWTLPNQYHFAAYEIIRHWEFRVVSEFVWCKTQLGKGQYWRMSHEILLTAVRTEEDSFDDHSLRSWIATPRGQHSEKPDAIHEFLERASPGPRLELYARQIRRGWFAWGHEIAEPLTEQAAIFDEPDSNDRYFTKRPLARRLYEITTAKIAELHIQFDCWLEPAAGDGAFLDLLPPEDRLGIDVEPSDVEGVIQQDFLSYNDFGFRVYGTIGNPPFGKNSNMAIRFFNYCARISSFIAFILPRTFKKDSVINKLDENFHLEYEELLPDNSFEVDGRDKSVPTVFQIWVRKPYPRGPVEILDDHEDLEFLPPERSAEADILFQRIGVGAGTIKYDPAEHSSESHFLLKCSENAEAILQTINWNAVKHNTAGNPSISKSDLLKTYTRRKHELRYVSEDFYVVERNSINYLVRNGVCTKIDDPELQVDKERLTITIGSICHEFPNRADFGSFVEHFFDYTARCQRGTKS